jgi:phosphoserine/homoserine phosphotransferase
MGARCAGSARSACRASTKKIPFTPRGFADPRGAFFSPSLASLGINSPVKQTIVTLDLEGVLVPEIWIAVAEKTGIEALRRTTRDEPDYDVLMRHRLDLLAENNLKLSDIQDVIATLAPMEGAKAFLDEVRARTQLVILSDTFLQFAKPLMRQLDWPALFCHQLEVRDDVIMNYHLRQSDQKRKSVAAFQSLNYHVIAAGDSYNDTSMLAEADQGILFRAPNNVIEEFPQFPAVTNYAELMDLIFD